MDLAGYISPGDQAELSRLLYDYNRIGRAQIQVLVLPDLQGEEIETASIKITDAWKLGNKDKDNGILFLVSAAERKLRIEVGQGLEGVLPDVYAKRIISDQVIPYFKARRTSDGIRSGVYSIIQVVDKEYADSNGLGTAEVQGEAGPEGKKRPLLTFIIFFVLLLILIGGGRGGGRGFLLGAVLGSLGGRGGRDGWGGGGGGWSGGGGGFSGGGASGSW